MPSLKIPRSCERCGKEFLARPCDIRRGRGRFCSHLCCNLVVGHRRYTPLQEAFRLRVGSATPTGCLPWTGHCGEWGYGQVSVRLVSGWRSQRAHRVAWELANGPIPAGLCVLHRCDNPPCVNVEHLFLGTLAVNSADMIAKGRSTRGQKNPRAKLTEEMIRFIRAHAGEMTQAELADTFNVTQTTISCIITRKIWKHLP
jgi:hypothetical protein